MLKPGPDAPVAGTALVADAARGKRRSFLLLVPPVAIAILYIVVAESAVAFVRGYDLGLRWRGLTTPFAFWVFGAMAMFVAAMVTGSRWRVALRDTISWPRALGALLLLLLSALFFNAFSHYKAALPMIRPFSFDVLFAELDRLLHFGRDPWRLLHPLVGAPAATIALDWLYYAWVPVNLVAVTAFAWLADHALRARFYTAYFLTWALLGSGLATLLSSAGPCYYALLGLEPDPFLPLMEYLHSVNADQALTTIHVQRTLWLGYEGTIPSPEGIAAMPSLHVAMPVLYALVTRERWPRLSAFFALLAFLILIGSVHLGWHYAIDGYVAAIGTAFIWWLSERLRLGRERNARPQHHHAGGGVARGARRSP